MRRLTLPAPDLRRLSQAADRLLADLEIAVVTPLFGGGATPRAPDPDWPIRPAAIRGHLRFWWRACAARQFTDAAELFMNEGRYWGTTPEQDNRRRRDATGPGPAAIQVAVDVLDAGQPTFTYHEYHERERRWFSDQDRERVGPGYALFPFQPQQGQRGQPGAEAVPGWQNVRFRLRLTLAADRTDPADIEACKLAANQALWAWIAFGGVGARTRRGCGTLFCVGNGDGLANVPESGLRLDAALFRPSGNPLTWLRETASHLVKPGTGVSKVPSLAGASLVLGEATTHPIDAWRKAVETMQNFRQGVRVGRNPPRDRTGPPRPGRSRWPEPDSVRDALRLNAPPFNDPHLPAHPARPFYPRADLGLPIIFQRMGNGPLLDGHLDGARRLASPVLLKSLPTGKQEAVALALLLDAPHVWDDGTPGVRLNGADRPLPREQLVGNNAARVPAPLMKDGAGRVYESAREAFMAFAASSPGWRPALERFEFE